jgi:hypothetical protein
VRFDIEMEDSLIATLVKIFNSFCYAKSNILQLIPIKDIYWRVEDMSLSSESFGKNS